MRLKELRLEKGLTQFEVASGIGTYQSNVGRWEREEVLPSSDFIVKLADFFAVSADYLLERSDDLGGVTSFSSAPSLTSKEEELLRLFRKISPTLQDTAIRTLQVWADEPKKSSLPKRA